VTFLIRPARAAQLALKLELTTDDGEQYA
jgi:hypothetical protein